MIERPRHKERCLHLLDSVPCVAILGARQVGKTTLAKALADSWGPDVHLFDLERPSDLIRLEDPEVALGSLTGLVVLDEIQWRPELFPVLRALIDDDPTRRFLVLGSASPDLLRQSSESLAGRISYHELPPFSIDEVGVDVTDRLWMRGGFPRSFTASDDPSSFDRRLDFVRTFIARDLPALGMDASPVTIDRFWRMLAHGHGQLWNGSRIGGSLGLSDKTVRGYLDLLTAALVVEQLRPWHENVGKRQVKAPKVYIGDSGILHALLDLPDRTSVERHPILGASWEGFILRQLAVVTGSRPDQRYFWATHAGAELDLLIVRGNERIGFEIKRTATPKVTASLRSAIETLHLDEAYIVHAGPHTFPTAHGVQALAATDLLELRSGSVFG